MSRERVARSRAGLVFFFTDPAPTKIYTLSLHDALPIWRDMTQFDGYLTHELIEDLDDPGHLLVVRQWTTRQRADEVLHEYATHPNARRANELVSRPRTRFVGHAVPGRA